jgi:putative transcriptional regulator
MVLNSKNNPQAGDLLISEPFLQDENFVRSVILVCENNVNGTFGLVLNKLSILRISDLIENFHHVDQDVFVGGPVEQNTLHFIYFGDQLFSESISLGHNLWWGGNYNELKEKLMGNDLDLNYFRFFLGYSGWSYGQLMEELEANTWIICPLAESENIFTSSPDELWKIILKNMGGEFQQMANYPIDPRLN